MPNRFNTGCCQCGGCTGSQATYDEFNRADSTNLGADWSEISGDWSIASNKLSIGSANAFVLYDLGTISPTQLVVAAGVTLAASGDRFRIILDRLDGSNYHYVEWEKGPAGPADGNGYTKFGKVTGGADAEIARQSWGTLTSIDGFTGFTGDLAACITGNAIFARSAGLSVGIGHYTSPHGGTKVGIGTGSVLSAPVTINRFTTHKHQWVYTGVHNAWPCQICPRSCTVCQERTGANQYKITASGIADGTLLCDCTENNGVFYCDKHLLVDGNFNECAYLAPEVIGGGGCIWRWVFYLAAPDFVSTGTTELAGGEAFTLRVQLQRPFGLGWIGVAQWSKAVTARINCAELDEVLTLDGAPADCDCSGATLRVQAV